MRLTADDLVAAVNRRCGWGSVNGPLADSAASETHSAAVLALADEELQGDAYPLVMAANGEYYATSKDYTIVAGQRRYRLPPLIHNAIKDVVWVDTNGREFSLGTISAEDVPRLSYVVTVGTAQGSSYYLEGDSLCLHPVPTSADGTLRLKYYRQPGKLALTSSTRAVAITGVTAWNSSTGAVGITIADATHFYPASAAGDVVGGGNTHATIVTDVTMSHGSGGTALIVTWTQTEDPLLAVGDYICSPGYSPLVQLPDHMQPYFVRRVAGACLLAQGDREGAAAELQSAAALYEKAQSTSRPRNQAEPNTIITRNSPLRARGGFGYYRGP